MVSAKQKIIDAIGRFNHKYSRYAVFFDWVKCSALVIANNGICEHDAVWERREEEYKQIKQKYSENEIKTFSHMFGMLCEAYEENIEDVLGDVYMKSGCYSKELGQFFTPFHLAILNAEAGMPTNIENYKEITVSEPSSGGGANIIAAAKVISDRGFDFREIMKVDAKDLDWLSVYMTYVQLSLLGISAKVMQGNSLEDDDEWNEKERVFYTPKRRWEMHNGRIS